MKLSRQQGAMSTELAVLTPLLIGFMLLAVYAGRVAETEGDVAHAAYEAARAATLTGNTMTAVAAAEEAAAANITHEGVACRQLDVTVDTTNFAAGGQVAVTVSCEASYTDLAMVAVPGARTFTSTAISVIDTYRAEPGDVP